MIHQSKKDLWMVLLAFGVPAIQLSIGVYILVVGASPIAGWSQLAGGLFTGAIFLLFVYPIRYETRKTDLLIQSGRLRWKIPYNRITDVTPTRLWLSGPAWSLDRLLVSYRRGSNVTTVLISPKDKDSFLIDLAAAAPELKRSGESLKSD